MVRSVVVASLGAALVLVAAPARGAPTRVPRRPPANTSPPAVSGSAQEGATLTASTGSWKRSPTSYAYQWRRCPSPTDPTSCTGVAGATSSTYALTGADVGFAMRVDVVAANAAGASAPAESAATAVVAPASPPSGEDPFDLAVRHDFSFAATQESRVAARIATTAYPMATDPVSLRWKTTDASVWTSGFFPGDLWLLAEQGDDASRQAEAQAWTAGVEGQSGVTTNTDLGFMFMASAGNGFWLTGDDGYRQALLAAARSLAAGYSPVVGAIRSRGDGVKKFNVVVDSVMDTELLFWAAAHGGDPSLSAIALSHVTKAMENNVRADGSVWQMVQYDPATGAVVGKSNPQGYSAASTWSRGQAWAIYGFTMAYRYTGDAQFLQTAERTADWYLAHLPADDVPYWDFGDPKIPNAPRDSSAAAIAAAGLLELAVREPDPARAQRYLDGATSTIAALSSSAYLAEGTGNEAVLLHGTQNFNAGQVDTGLAEGDYYFLQALLRLRWLLPQSPPLPIASVSASGDDGDPAANAVDGDLDTHWSAAGDGQSLTVDLGTSRTVHEIAIAWWQGDVRSTRFELQTSADGTTWTTVLATRSGSIGGAPTPWETYDVPDADARYVRVVGHGNTVDAVTGIDELAVY